MKSQWAWQTWKNAGGKNMIKELQSCLATILVWMQHFTWIATQPLERPEFEVHFQYRKWMMGGRIMYGYFHALFCTGSCIIQLPVGNFTCSLVPAVKPTHKDAKIASSCAHHEQNTYLQQRGCRSDSQYLFLLFLLLKLISTRLQCIMSIACSRAGNNSVANPRLACRKTRINQVVRPGPEPDKKTTRLE